MAAGVQRHVHPALALVALLWLVSGPHVPPAVAGQPVESTTVAANTEFTSNALPRRMQDTGDPGAVDCSAAGLHALCELEAQGPDALPAAFRGGWDP